ncbi:TetR/AcrR family transcriptional regulator [Streptomyces violens]|uniref:TetR/AcrR family transcriptional regulator n=1 Tax=Streptomyces violens TaxID=66377 RepID=UPI0007C86630|nr:TetR/AcrR family transcriptional regulator [Streptomyces violens]
MPTQHRAIQSRQALIRSAAQSFIDKGVSASGMVDISRRARLSKGALYFHFESKEELTLAVRDEALGALRELEEQLLRAPDPLLSASRDFAAALLDRVDRDVVVRAGLRIRPESDPAPSGALLHRRWCTLFLEKAAADRSAGRLPPDTDPQRLARALTTMVVGLLELGHADRTWWSREAVTDMWRQLVPAPRAVPAGAGAGRPLRAGPPGGPRAAVPQPALRGAAGRDPAGFAPRRTPPR